jgi:hypothetical protein
VQTIDYIRSLSTFIDTSDTVPGNLKSIKVITFSKLGLKLLDPRSEGVVRVDFVEPHAVFGLAKLGSQAGDLLAVGIDHALGLYGAKAEAPAPTVGVHPRSDVDFAVAIPASADLL